METKDHVEFLHEIEAFGKKIRILPNREDSTQLYLEIQEGNHLIQVHPLDKHISAVIKDLIELSEVSRF